MSTGQFRLSNLDIDFVSLVASGDDPLARVVIAKAAPEGKSMYAPDAVNAGNVMTPHQFANTDPQKHGAKKCDKCGMPEDAAMHKKMHGKMHKSANGDIRSHTLSPNDSSEENMGNISKDDLDPEVVAYIEGLEAEVDTLSLQVVKSEADLDAQDEQIATLTEAVAKSVPLDATPEEISKSLLEKADPAVRALIEKQTKDLAEVQEIAKTERNLRLDREFVSKAATLPMLGDDKAALAGLLRRASEALSAEDNTVLDTVLKAANTQIAQGNLFANFGKGGGETTISKSVKAMAVEIRKADPNLTIEQAEAKVYEENPDLFTQAMTGEDA